MSECARIYTQICIYTYPYTNVLWAGQHSIKMIGFNQKNTYSYTFILPMQYSPVLIILQHWYARTLIYSALWILLHRHLRQGSKTRTTRLCQRREVNRHLVWEIRCLDFVSVSETQAQSKVQSPHCSHALAPASAHALSSVQIFLRDTLNLWIWYCVAERHCIS